MSLEEAVLNGWWQGMALTALVWVVMRGQTRVSAATRLAIWQVTMAVVVLMPGIAWLSWQLVTQPAPAAASVAAVRSTEATSALAPDPVEPAEVPAIAPVSARPIFTFNDEKPVILLLVSGMVLAGLQLLRLAIGYWVVRRIKRQGVESGVIVPRFLNRDARILLSSRIGMPMAIGYRNPAIVLPEKLVRSMHTEEIEQIVLHEAAHLERNDDWHGLFERLVRAVFFVQPAMWFIGQQLERERELACDDWVVDRNGESKVYASALARVAEIGSLGSMPMLATGAGRRKEIFARMEALLDQTRNRVPSVSGPMVMAAALLIVFVVSQSAPFSRVFGFSQYDSRVVISDGNMRREFSMRGDISFTDDEQDIQSMTPGSRILISREDGWIRRSVEVEGDDNGQAVRHYFVGGVAQPYGSEAKRFVAKELPNWLKQQGHNLTRRLERWVHVGGIDGALREIEDVPNGGVKNEYLRELYRGSTFDGTQLRQWLRQVERLESDEGRAALVETAAVQARLLGFEPILIDVVQKMHSDDMRMRTLRYLLPDLQDGSLPRWLRAAGALHNDDAKRELLVAMASETRRDLTAQFFETARTMHSDDGMKEVLHAAIVHHGAEQITQQETIAQANRLHSDHYKSEVAVELLEQQRKLDDATLAEMRKLATRLHNNQERDALLERINSR